MLVVPHEVDGTIVASASDMSAQPKRLITARAADADSDDADSDENVIPCVLRVPCPGKAHRTGEDCLVCDEETDGWISIIVTGGELDALGCASLGRPVDVHLSPRLYALGLLHDVEGVAIPTERGYALLGGPVLPPN